MSDNYVTNDNIYAKHLSLISYNVASSQFRISQVIKFDPRRQGLRWSY